MLTTIAQFDVSRARAALNRATVTESGSGMIKFAAFEIPNSQNGTRTVIGVNHHDGEIHVRITAWPIDSLPVDRQQAENRPLCGGDFHYVEAVEYHCSKVDPMVTFILPTKSGTPSWLNIHNDGRWDFKVA